MFKIKILAVGKKKEKSLKDFEKEFLKRISPFAKIELVEIKEESFGKNSDAEKIKNLEAGKILGHLKPAAYTISLERTGQALSSEDLAELISREGESGREFIFIIGGALGLSTEVLKNSDLKLSLSRMTFTHKMARIFLLEQIYRAMTIIKGKIYHY